MHARAYSMEMTLYFELFQNWLHHVRYGILYTDFFSPRQCPALETAIHDTTKRGYSTKQKKKINAQLTDCTVTKIKFVVSM